MLKQKINLKRRYKSNQRSTSNIIGKQSYKKLKIDLQIPYKIKQNCKNINVYQTIEQVPCVQLTSQDMQLDPIQLFMHLETKFKQYGAIKLKTSINWNPPFCFQHYNRAITTRVQRLEQLHNGKPFEQKIQTTSFKNFTQNAIAQDKAYKFKTNPKGSTLHAKRQHEYWNLVSQSECILKQKYKTTVQYGADLPVSRYGSGFPRVIPSNKHTFEFQYHKNWFNLNNLYKSPKSLMNTSFERRQHISGITNPWVYIGMQFATFCWHVEDLWLNSINYNHKGGTKTWYVVPGTHKNNFDDYIKKKYCLNQRNKNLLDRITLMVNPLELIKNKIPVYKINQNPKEYVCTFFKAYHCGFSHAYNVGQAVNFASPFSLKYIEQAINNLKQNEIKKNIVFPIQWLVSQNIDRNNDLQGYITLVQLIIIQQIEQKYEQILKQEQNNLKQIINNYPIKIWGNYEFFKQNTKYTKYYCMRCKNYCYFIIFECQNCEMKLCYKHLQQHNNNNINNQNKLYCNRNKIKYKIYFRQFCNSRLSIIKLFPNLNIIYKEYLFKINKNSKNTNKIIIQQ